MVDNTENLTAYCPHCRASTPVRAAILVSFGDVPLGEDRDYNPFDGKIGDSEITETFCARCRTNIQVALGEQEEA